MVHAFITSHIDFANSLLFRVPATCLQKLQRVLNIDARIVTLTSKQDHITSILKTLHWLPIDQGVKYKILVLTFRALHDSAPSYIKDLLTTYEPTRSYVLEDRICLPFLLPDLKPSFFSCSSLLVESTSCCHSFPDFSLIF